MNKDDYMQLQENIKNSEGYIATGLIEGFFKSYSVLNKNYEDISALFTQLRKPDVILEMFKEGNEKYFELIEINFLSCLTNYLSSMNMLIDHARIFVKNYPDTSDFAVEYKERITEKFIKSPRHLFLKGLRNYCLHAGLPIAKFEWSFGGNTLFKDNLVKFDLDALLSFSGFNGKVKEYLKEMEAIIIENIIDEYMQTLTNFYKWFFKELSKLHKEDVEKANKLIKLFNDI